MGRTRGRPPDADPPRATEPAPPALGEDRHREAIARWQVLRPHLDDGIALAQAAREAGVSPRTAQRWLTRYRRDGLAGLTRPPRADAGRHRFPDELVALIEGLVLTPPRPSAVTITRQVAPVARAKGWPVPSYQRLRDHVPAGLAPADLGPRRAGGLPGALRAGLPSPGRAT